MRVDKTIWDILWHCVTFRTLLLKCRKWHFRDSSFKFFPGGMPPEPQNITRLRRALCVPPSPLNSRATPTPLLPLDRYSFSKTGLRLAYFANDFFETVLATAAWFVTNRVYKEGFLDIFNFETMVISTISETSDFLVPPAKFVVRCKFWSLTLG